MIYFLNLLFLISYRFKLANLIGNPHYHLYKFKFNLKFVFIKFFIYLFLSLVIIKKNFYFLKLVNNVSINVLNSLIF
jgi:hypothetical protein